MKNFNSKRLTKKQIQQIWDEKQEKYFMLGYHWELYNIIQDCTLRGERCTVKYICERMPEYYYLNNKQSNFSNCPELYDDIDYINASSRVDKIIIKDNNDFRLATREEAINYAKKVQIEGLKKLKKYWCIVRKIQKDKQTQMFDKDINPVDDESVKEVNAFMDEIISEFNKLGLRKIGEVKSNAIF